MVQHFIHGITILNYKDAIFKYCKIIFHLN